MEKQVKRLKKMCQKENQNNKHHPIKLAFISADIASVTVTTYLDIFPFNVYKYNCTYKYHGFPLLFDNIQKN